MLRTDYSPFKIYFPRRAVTGENICHTKCLFKIEQDCERIVTTPERN